MLLESAKVKESPPFLFRKQLTAKNHSFSMSLHKTHEYPPHLHMTRPDSDCPNNHYLPHKRLAEQLAATAQKKKYLLTNLTKL